MASPRNPGVPDSSVEATKPWKAGNEPNLAGTAESELPELSRASKPGGTKPSRQTETEPRRRELRRKKSEEEKPAEHGRGGLNRKLSVRAGNMAGSELEDDVQSVRNGGQQ